MVGRPRAAPDGGEPQTRHEDWRAVFELGPIPMYQWRRDGEDLLLAGANRAGREVLGGLLGTFLGQRASRFFAGEPQVLLDLARTLELGRPVQREMSYLARVSGELSRLLVTYLPIGDDTVIVHTEDLTALRRSETEYRNLVERLPAIAYTAEIGADTPFHFVSPQVRSMLGYDPQGWVDSANAWFDAVHPDDQDAVRATEDRDWVPGQQMRQEYRMVASDGQVIWISDEAVVRGDGPGRPARMEGLMTDVTGRKELEVRLRHLAERDPLTELFNRRRFVEALSSEMALARREGRPSSLLLIDVDDFKGVNDSLGHGAGDDVLRWIARQLTERLRRTDVVARFGGDEFAAVLPGDDVVTARGVAESLRQAITTGDPLIAGQSVGVAVSIGVADAASGSTTADEVIAAADLALYEAKRTGRDRVATYEPRLAADLALGRSWSTRLRRALDHDSFVLHGQPIVSLATGEVTQYELLLRLVGEDGELVAPGEFLPHAERLGLMPAIDHWVVRTAIRTVAGLAAAGRTLRVEINLTGPSLGDPTLIDLIARELGRTGIDPGLLVFEVTETAAIHHMPTAQTFAAQVKALGCALALDDFGAGFASFYYVKHLPFDHLKIDGEFVRSIVTDPTDQAVVRAIVDVARTLGRTTIAEFVGDEATVSALRELGVDLVQGFHVGRPAPFPPPV